MCILQGSVPGCYISSVLAFEETEIVDAAIKSSKYDKCMQYQRKLVVGCETSAEAWWLELFILQMCPDILSTYKHFSRTENRNKKIYDMELFPIVFLFCMILHALT